MIDKTKNEIDKELDDLYKNAVENAEKDKKMFVLIYYSGEGINIFDPNVQGCVAT